MKWFEWLDWQDRRTWRSGAVGHERKPNHMAMQYCLFNTGDEYVDY
jgi:hypothetical protein